MARRSQPTPSALRAGAGMKMLCVTPWTANTKAAAPNTDIWKRCIAIESVARV